MCWKKWVTKLIAALVLLPVLVTNVIALDLSTQVLVDRGGDFTLHSKDGPVSLRQFRGKVVLLFFGYTACPDVCPTTLAVLANVFSKLEVRELEKVTALFVSLDPDRDTPELLHQYTGYFHPNIIGVTAAVEVLDLVTENYGVAYERKVKASSPLGYVINHTLDVLVINREGELMATRIRASTRTEDILAYLKTLIGSNR
jgi:protein SCO1/2